MKITLERFYQDNICTIGRMRIEGKIIYTLELPWNYNKFEKSCIPAWIYKVKRRYLHTPKFMQWSNFKYPHYILTGTGKRTGILIHRGNYPDETTGCILPGLKIDDKMENVWNSKDALDYMLSVLPDKFELEIRNVL